MVEKRVTDNLCMECGHQCHCADDGNCDCVIEMYQDPDVSCKCVDCNCMEKAMAKDSSA